MELMGDFFQTQLPDAQLPILSPTRVPAVPLQFVRSGLCRASSIIVALSRNGRFLFARRVSCFRSLSIRPSFPRLRVNRENAFSPRPLFVFPRPLLPSATCSVISQFREPFLTRASPHSRSLPLFPPRFPNPPTDLSFPPPTFFFLFSR